LNLVKSTTILLFLSITGLSDAATTPEQQMDAYIQAWQQQNMFSGTVLVAQNDTIVFQNAYGKADIEKDILNTLDTRFRIGSLTKAFTALLVLQLDKQGQLHTHDPLSRWVPEQTRADEITLEMLLHHRSGIPDHTELPDFQTRRRTQLCPPAQTIKTFQSLPLESSPGSRFKYSSSNYILLGYIIEKTTQKPYADILQENILAPAGLAQTGFELYQQPPDNMAVGYRNVNGKILPANNRIMQNAHASGGLYSTVKDLYRWNKVLDPNNGIFDKDVLLKMQNPPYPEYGYGWAGTSILDKKAWAHSGQTEGFMSFIIRFIEDNACVIVLSNLEQAPVDRISIDLAAILFDKPYNMPQKAVTVDADMLADYKSYVGRYQVRPGFVFNITRQGRNLYCQATGQQRLQLVPTSKTEFVINEVNATVTFIKDPNGRVRRLILRQNGSQVTAEKQ